MGLKLFFHAVRLVLDNLVVALRISGVLYLLQIVVAIGLLLFLQPSSQGALLTYLVVVILLSVFCSIWTAVAWHRFILLDEVPSGWLPAFNGGRLLAYFGYSLLLGIIAIPILLGAGLLAGLFASAGGPLVALIATVAVFFVVLIIGYRLALILPGSSVDKRMGLGDAWDATRGATGDIVVLALVSAIGAAVLGLPSSFLIGPLQIVGMVWSVVAQWITLLVGISILTTLYGHYVEKRPIRD